MNKKLKIYDYLFVLNGITSITPGSAAGGTTHILALINKLSKKKVGILLPKNSVEKYLHFNIDAFSYSRNFLDNLVNKNNIIFFIVSLIRILQNLFILSDIKTNYFIASSHLFYNVLPMFFIKPRKKYIVYIYHIISDQRKNTFYNFLVCFFEKFSFFVLKMKKSYVITDSKSITDDLINIYKFDKNYIYTSSNGINMPNRIYKKKKYDLIYCGRLNKTKGVYDLINIVSLLREKIPSIRCGVIGEGIEREKMERLIKEKGLTKQIFFKGFVSEKRKIKLIQSSKIFILPSHEEGWGIVIGEALASGVPVVVYRIKQIIKIWKDSVIWVKTFDINEFVEKISRLLSNIKMQEQYSKYGLKFVQQYNWKSILKKEINFIQKK